MAINLSPRLKAMADMVISGEKAADIGTDHGYLPVYLVINGICPYVIATDRAKEALLLTEELIARYRLQGKIDIRRGEGLKVLIPGEASTVCLGGMGGFTMIGIFEATPEVLQATKRLVLQPQTDIEELRLYLQNAGWKIVQEAMVKDSGFYYQAMALEKGQMTLNRDEACYGPLLIRDCDSVLMEYLREKRRADLDLIEELKKTGSEKSKEKMRILWEEINTLEKVLSKMTKR